MKFRAPLCLLTMIFPLALSAAEEKTPKTPKPTLLHRMLHPFGGDAKTGPGHTAPTGFKQLDMGVQVEPTAVKLADVKQMKVTVTLANKGKKIAQLDFPTSQRIEVLVKSKEGKTVEQWSEDQAFNSDPTIVAINPNERLEYVVNVATRDLVAGESYIVEAFFPNFDQLRKTVPISAQK